jgi:hypothetical protein
MIDDMEGPRAGANALALGETRQHVLQRSINEAHYHQIRSRHLNTNASVSTPPAYLVLRTRGSVMISTIDWPLPSFVAAALLGLSPSDQTSG